MQKTNNQSHSRLVVTGGGTGGHLFAGLALAREHQRRHGIDSVHFYASTGEIEKRELPKTEVKYSLFQVLPLKGKSLLFRIKSAIIGVISLLSIARALLRHRPTAILGVGGFVSGPVILCAYILKLLRFIPLKTIAILEQNAVPGFTNRVLSHISDRVFVAFAGVESVFPDPSKCIVSGNPIREAIKNISLENVSGKNPHTPPHLLIFGGSQGARGINRRMLLVLSKLKETVPGITWLHQCGVKEYESVRAEYVRLKLPETQLVPFIDDMPKEYRRADLIICRAGSSTLSELSFVLKPALLIPFPAAADNHQEKNAQHFAKTGAAKVMLELNPDERLLLKDGLSSEDLINRSAERWYQEIRLALQDSVFSEVAQREFKKFQVLDSNEVILKQLEA